MHAFVTYFGNIGPHFHCSRLWAPVSIYLHVLSFSKQNILHALHFLSSWWRDLWFLLGPFIAQLSIVFYYYFKRKTQKIWFCSWKLKLLMQLVIPIKDAFSEVFMMIPLWALVHYGPLCTLRALLAPSVVCKNMSSFDVVWFSPIDGVIFLVMH
jgi:hypothetical protein